MALPEILLEYLHVKRIRVATEMKISEHGMKAYAVIIPIIAGTPKILTRNLLYTAVTRAKKLVVLVGTKYGLKRMVDNDYTAQRYTALKEFMKDEQEKVKKLFKLTTDN